MSDEKIDLSEFDEIPDRVARAKAKAEALRKAREAAAGDVSGETPADEASSQAPDESGGESAAAEVDLSSLDEIQDRVARAKAKAELMRKARGGAKPAPAGAPAKKAASTADRAAAARALTQKTDEPAEERVIVQTSPAPPAIRPGPERTQAIAEGGMTTRRGFFTWLTLAWASFAAASAAGLLGFGRFLFPNVLFEPPQSFKIGFAEDYDLGVDERWKDKFSVWIVKSTQDMFALISVCTHLGCTPNWLGNEQKFKCPCHGSGFYMSGINFEGPAPRPLERARIVLAEDGQVLVDKTRKFLYEKGHWDNPESFLRI
jgi:cytochrome b6-f complex iron-sulfur subunit